MPNPFSRLLLTALVASATLLGCTEPEPTRPVQLGQGLLDMAISEKWQLESSSDDSDANATDEGRVYLHSEIPNLRLRIATRAEDYGNPLRVIDVKSVIGKELNREYGGVTTRVSLGGNAMIKYARLVEGEQGGELRAEEWVIAKPFAYSHVARIEISLQIPVSAESNPSLPELIESLDKQVGDAKIPVT